MNNKLEQLSVAYKKAVGTILQKEFPHEPLLTVTDLLIDPSGQTGRVWLATTPEILKDVEKLRGDIQRQLKDYVVTRFTPKFSFLLDDRYLDHIEGLFNKLDNKVDEG